MKKLSLVVFALLAPLLLISQWYPQTSGTTENLLNVCFTDSSNGWVTGEELEKLTEEIYDEKFLKSLVLEEA